MINWRGKKHCYSSFWMRVYSKPGKTCCFYHYFIILLLIFKIILYFSLNRWSQFVKAAHKPTSTHNKKKLVVETSKCCTLSAMKLAIKNRVMTKEKEIYISVRSWSLSHISSKFTQFLPTDTRGPRCAQSLCDVDCVKSSDPL